LAWLKNFQAVSGNVANTLQRDFSPTQFKIRFHFRTLINQLTGEKIDYVEKLCYIDKYLQYYFAQKYEECKQEHEKFAVYLFYCCSIFSLPSNFFSYQAFKSCLVLGEATIEA